MKTRKSRSLFQNAIYAKLIVIPALMLITVVLMSYRSMLEHTKPLEIITNSLFALVNFFVIIFILNSSESEQNFKGDAESWYRLLSIYPVCYAAAILFTALSPELRPVAVISMIMALMFGQGTGLISNILFSGTIVLLTADSFEVLFLYLLFGTIACIMVKYFHVFRLIFFASVILFMSQLLLLILFQYMLYEKIVVNRLIQGMISVLIDITVLLLTMFYRNQFVKKRYKHKLKRICSDQYPPIANLKRTAPQIYFHSVQVSALACHAAEEAEADVELTKAGALYHDIGKPLSKDYIKAGLQIANRYRIPAAVKMIILEHNSKVCSPKSIESAIVMLSDSVISTIDFMKNKQEKYIDEHKLIDNILTMRMQSGLLDSCGMSIEQFNEIKRAFLKAYTEKNY